MAKTLPLNLKEALLDAMKVAETSIEGAEYLATRFKTLLKETKMIDKYKDILQKVEDFAKYTTFKLGSSANPWLGQINTSSNYKNMQAGIALDAAKALQNISVQNITFDYAVNEQSQFLRLYSQDGQTLDPKTLESTDKLFNAFLAENNIVSQGSVLYQSTDHGQIKLDAAGNKARVDAQKFKDLISDPDKGFQKYMAKKGISLISQEQQYPSAQKDAQAKRTLNEAIAEKEAPAVVDEVPEVEPRSSL